MKPTGKTPSSVHLFQLYCLVKRKLCVCWFGLVQAPIRQNQRQTGHQGDLFSGVDGQMRGQGVSISRAVYLDRYEVCKLAAPKAAALLATNTT